MIYGYCRISTPKQSIDRQVRNIEREYPEAHIVQETYTGTTTRRPRWDRLKRQVLMQAEKGEDVVIVFDAVSRMSRDAQEGFSLYEELFNAGIELVFLKEPHINTSVYKKSLQTSIPETGTSVDILLDGVKRYLMELAKEQIRIAFQQAEKEVQDLHRRTSEGIMTARLNGKQIGRRKGQRIVTQKQRKAVEIIIDKNCDFCGTLTDTECMQLIGCSRNSFYKYKKICRAN